jgi:hypothetical protein
MHDRLNSRTEATKRFVKSLSRFKKEFFFPLSEQYEAVYDDKNKIVYTSDANHDYFPETSLLNQIRAEKKYILPTIIHAWAIQKRVWEYLTGKTEGCSLLSLRPMTCMGIT